MPKRWPIVLLSLILICLTLAGFLLFRNQQIADTSEPGVAQEISPAMLATHTGLASCWVSDGSKVFNATMYLDGNPGSSLAQKCGTIVENLDKNLYKQLELAYIGILVP